MKLKNTAENRWALELARREKEMLTEVLRLYPCIPPAHQPLSKGAPQAEASQRLLDEALAEQRAENKAQVDKLLADTRRWTPREQGVQLALSTAEVEWLLQVFNDIRVGSWIALGSPEELPEELTEATAPHLWAMELAGHLEMIFLEGLQGLGGHA